MAVGVGARVGTWQPKTQLDLLASLARKVKENMVRNRCVEMFEYYIQSTKKIKQT